MVETTITPFIFEGEHLIRVTEASGAPWFAAIDVCRAIGIRDVSDAVEKLDADEKGRASIPTPGGAQDILIISEGGLYSVVLRSRQAMTPGTVQHRFRKWVTGEVLPSIRKTGGYGAAPPKPAPDAPWREKPLEEKRVELTTAALLAKVDSPERALWYIDNEMRIPGPPRPYKPRRQMGLDLGDGAEELQDIMSFASAKANGEGTH